MALSTCHECGAEVSTAAKSCPNCGARGKAFKGPPHGYGFWSKALLGFLGISLVAGLVGALKGPPKPPTAAETAEKAQEDKRDLAIMGYARALKLAMRNPDALVFERVVSDPDGNRICFKYRGQNGFGGTNREWIAFSPAGSAQDSRSIERVCRNDQMKDITFHANGLIKLIG